MEAVNPLLGVRYNPDHVRLSGVLAPPYDVITDAQREELYARDLRNVVRIDSGMEYPDDAPGVNDRYTRAAEFLRSWTDLGILVRDPEPSLYVTDHEYLMPDGAVRHRRGIFGVVQALPWSESPLRPHERTLRGPKEDRLALLRATAVQTSPVFIMASEPELFDGVLDGVMSNPPLLGGRTEGEFGSEKHLVWRVAEQPALRLFCDALSSSILYVADGHHRYEMAVAYAQERRAADPAAPHDAAFNRCLVYLTAADDSSLVILPTHRLVLPAHGRAFSIDDLWARLDEPWEIDAALSTASALSRAAQVRATHHAYAVVGRDGVAVLQRPRAGGSPRDGLDAVVLEREVLAPAGVDEAAVSAGALRYTRKTDELERAVRDGEAVLGFGLQPVETTEVIAVADAGETMPQKSTYFYPKVPTGIVLHQT